MMVRHGLLRAGGEVDLEAGVEAGGWARDEQAVLALDRLEGLVDSGVNGRFEQGGCGAEDVC